MLSWTPPPDTCTPGYLCLSRPAPPAADHLEQNACTAGSGSLSSSLPSLELLLGCFQTLPSLSHTQAKPSRNTQGRNPLAGVPQNAWSGPSPRAVPGAQCAPRVSALPRPPPLAEPCTTRCRDSLRAPDLPHRREQ